MTLFTDFERVQTTIVSRPMVVGLKDDTHTYILNDVKDLTINFTEDQLNSIEELLPEDYELPFSEFNVDVLKNEIEKAKSLIQNSLHNNIEIDFADPYLREIFMGIKSYKNKKFEEAYEIFNQMLMEHPDDYFILMLLGHTLLQLKNYQGALMKYSRIAKNNPLMHEAWYFKGNAYHLLKDYKNAMECYKRCLGIKGDYIPAIDGINKIKDLSLSS
ncbi:MAG: tetratricopeptide repeat protein [Candidatus Heimdallarchaeota archaeon]|nr:tetratricopeptide repeat protein [Candidatus Heimdallarchaeota archaeon]